MPKDVAVREVCSHFQAQDPRQTHRRDFQARPAGPEGLATVSLSDGSDTLKEMKSLSTSEGFCTVWGNFLVSPSPLSKARP